MHMHVLELQRHCRKRAPKSCNTISGSYGLYRKRKDFAIASPPCASLSHSSEAASLNFTGYFTRYAFTQGVIETVTFTVCTHDTC
jgi:hypothetical protein